MRHRKSHRKLGRRKGARRALLRSLVIGLFSARPTDDHAERIVTTPAKAKAARRFAEKLITLGKKGTLAARRRALELLPNKRVIRKLFDEIAPRYTDRDGGYTRILRLGRHRVGDDAQQVILELVGLSAPREPQPVRPTVSEQEPEEAPEEDAAAEGEPEAEEPEEGEAEETPEEESDETSEEEPAGEGDSGGSEETGDRPG
jgi:large subunit ribosomal protein L17